MSKRHNGLRKMNIFLIIIMVISGIALLTSVIIGKNIIQELPQSREDFGVILIFFMISFVIFVGTTDTFIMSKYEKYKAKKAYKQIKEVRQLSNEFSEVKLTCIGQSKLSELISKEDVSCMAKLDENDNIVYMMQVDITKTTDNYGSFLDYFEI